jgi:hypothetical protein
MVFLPQDLRRDLAGVLRYLPLRLSGEAGSNAGLKAANALPSLW